ncbi:MAG: class I SAM-dependent methyltransferase [DPANN group archaeon]|nr:class I SAM-dependent methyltransferase [DPANN group archaeon]
MDIARADISHKSVGLYYDVLSRFYWIISLIDNKPKFRGVKISKPSKSDKVLCIGFGIGEELNYFLKKTPYVFGTELSGEMVRRVKNKGVNALGFSKADTLNLPFKDASFDIVYSAFLIDLLDTAEIEQAVSEMKRLVKLGGKVVGVNTTFEQGVIGRFLYRIFFVVRDVFCKNMRTRPIYASRFFDCAGFSDISHEKVYWGVECVVGVK